MSTVIPIITRQVKPDVAQLASRMAANWTSLLKDFVYHPESLRVWWSYSEYTNVLYFVAECDRRDVGLLIGRQGNNVEAIRDLLWSASGKAGISMRFSVIRNPE